jgi:hypothetical protein
MNLGLFFMPHLAPERTPKQGQEFILETIRKADELGYQEAWIGEHFACGWEPVPAPDLLIAQALTFCRITILWNWRTESPTSTTLPKGGTWSASAPGPFTWMPTCSARYGTSRTAPPP